MTILIHLTIQTFQINPDNPDNPNNPDNPDNPDTPDNPDIPDNPDNPDNSNIPDNPDIPVNPNNPENPSTPDNPNNPSNPNNSGNSNNNPNDKPNKPIDKPNYNDDENGKYKIYTIDNVSIKLISSLIKDKGTLNINSFELNEDLRYKFGSESEYYDIYLINDKSEIENIYSTEPINISIKIDPNKEFIGVYEITDDNIIKTVDYIKDDETIEITTKELGKYVVSYKNIDTSKPSNITPKRNKRKSIILTMIIIIIAFLGLSIYASKKYIKK